MSGFYVEVKRPEYSQALQEIAFQNGWEHGQGEGQIVQDTDKPYLWFVEKYQPAHLFEENTPQLAGEIYWDDEVIEKAKVYRLPRDFETVVNRLVKLENNREIFIEDNLVEFDYKKEQINVGCTTVPFGTVEKIYKKVYNSK